MPPHMPARSLLRALLQMPFVADTDSILVGEAGPGTIHTSLDPAQPDELTRMRLVAAAPSCDMPGGQMLPY